LIVHDDGHIIFWYIIMNIVWTSTRGSIYHFIMNVV
jgi:hypothetical protein